MINKKGEGYVTACVIIVAICMLLSVFISFVTVINTVKITRRNIRTVLDSFVMTTSVEIYNSVKQGKDEVSVLDIEGFSQSLSFYCDLDYAQNSLNAYDNNGNLKYRLSDLDLSFAEENRLMVIAGCTMDVPVKFCGMKIFSFSVPISVNARFEPKFLENMG